MNRIGLDVGTSMVKAVRFDASGSTVDVAAEPTVVHRPAPGRSEQDMEQVWAACVRVLRAVVGRSSEPVDLLALTGQGDGTWLVDGAGRPVGPALLWNDGRSAGQLAQWQRSGLLDEAFGVSGCSGAPGLANAQLHWLRAHEPDRLAAARTLLSCGSWVYQRLTGRRVVEGSEAANPFGSARSGDYAPELLSLFGLAELARLLPDVVTGSDCVSGLTREAAEAVGLPADTPVVLAPYDVVATATGAGVVAPGDGLAILGTTLCVGRVADDPLLDREPNGMTLPTGEQGSWLLAYATLSGTEVLDWVAGILGLPGAAAVAELAASAPPTDVPLMLPYLSPAGERSPFLDGRVRGGLLGLSTGHDRAAIARAAVEGTTLVVRDCLEAAGGAARLTVSGGGSRSPFWCQSISDATGVPVVVTDSSEVGALGAVLHGSVAVGAVPSLAEAARQGVTVTRCFMPDGEQHARLAAAYRRLVELRPLTIVP